jgi:hypothetical protein
MTSQILGSSFANGAQLPNYVNGRLLAAEDLATSQATLTERDEWVGQAAGTGLVHGLLVTAGGASLTVTSGLGITPSGEPVSVTSDVTLQLSMTGASTPTGVGFCDCATAPTGSQTAVTAGPYLLTVLPATQPSGQAPMALPPGADTPVPCTAQWTLGGVQFKAIPLPVPNTVDGVAITDANRRNLIAHWCFGTEQLRRLAVDPFNFTAAYRGIDQLSRADLTVSDLPLCVFYWDNRQVVFCDNWSVRRRVTRPDAASAPWLAVTEDQRIAEGEARLLEFQDQVLAIAAAGTSRSTVAAEAFGILPPSAFLPVALDQSVDDITSILEQVAAVSANAGQTDPNAPYMYVETFSNYDVLSEQTLEQMAQSFRQLSRQSGFGPQVFFGSAATRGGFITWDLAYTALRQSFFWEAVALQLGLQDGGATSTAQELVHLVSTGSLTFAQIAAGTPRKLFPFQLHVPAPAAIGPQSEVPVGKAPTLFTYYYVAETFIGALDAIRGVGPSVTPYLIFVKNQFCTQGTKPPLVTTSLAKS